jgi:hypothetical protein
MQFRKVIVLFLLTIVISGCGTGTPTSVMSVTPMTTVAPATLTPLPTSTSTPSPTSTTRPTRTPLPTPAPTFTSTPGPDMTLWYLDMEPLFRGVIEGQIYKYNLQTWSSTLADIPNNEGIRRATLSDDGKWLAYATEDELAIFNTALNRVEYKFPIFSRVDVSLRPLIFSEDGQLLAYDDVDGLNIINLQSGSNWRFLSNRISQADDVDWTHYSPRQFSTDNSWLFLVVGKWEDWWLAVVDLATKTVYRVDGCGNADGEWLNNNNRLVTAVIHTEYTGCGWDEGIHIVDTHTGNILDKQIYFEESPQYLYDGYGPRGIQAAPSGDSVIFVQDISDEFGDHVQSKLMLLSLDDLQAVEIASTTGGDIISPLWSDDAEVIYYAQQGKDSGVYRIDIASAESTQLASLDFVGPIYAVSPDKNWLVISQVSNRDSNLKLLNLTTGTIVFVADLGATDFLGWEKYALTLKK